MRYRNLFKKVFVFAVWMLVSVFMIPRPASAQTKTQAAANEIHWITFDQLEQKMKEQPKKILVDVYTAWCGWCKVLDKKTYSDPNVIRYVNDHFYAVKFDAEQKTDIKVFGQTFEYLPSQKVNRLAVELMQGRLSYPTTVFISSDVNSYRIPIPGFHEVPEMEMFLKFFGNDDQVKTQENFNTWAQAFKSEWKPREQ